MVEYGPTRETGYNPVTPEWGIVPEQEEHAHAKAELQARFPL